MKKLEADKIKLSEKWIKLSNKNKNEDKLKQRIKELEGIQTAKNSEIMDLYSKIHEFEQTNKNSQKGKLTPPLMKCMKRDNAMSAIFWFKLIFFSSF